MYPDCFYSRADLVRAVAPLGSLKIFGPWEKKYGWGGEYGVPELRDKWCKRLKYEELPSAFKSSTINLNSHVCPSGYLYLNERFTTVLGSGGFMLTDRVRGIEELLEEQPGFVVYDDLEDLKDKVRFYLRNDTPRRAITRAGLALAKSRFTNKLFAENLIAFASQHADLASEPA
jgi:glycosyltransferase involved in cell wall biosynthesis